MLKKLKIYIHLPRVEKELFFKAVRLALYYRLLTSLLPFKFYASRIGVRGKELASTSDYEMDILKNTFRAVRRSAHYLPFKEKCFIDALVAKKLLEKQGYASTLYLGIKKEYNKKMLAHAWLKCNDIIVIGKRGHSEFIVVEKFS